MQRERVSARQMLLYLLFLLLFYALQSSVFGRWSLQGFHLNLLPCFVSAAALLDGPAEGVIMGFAVGVFYDLGFSGIEGLYPIYFLLYGLAAGIVSRLVLPCNYISMLLLTAGETFLLGALRGFLYLIPRKGAQPTLILQQTAASAVLACALCFLVYLPLRRISRRFSYLD